MPLFKIKRVGSIIQTVFTVLIGATIIIVTYLNQSPETQIRKSRASGPLLATGKDLDTTCLGAARYDYCSQAPKCPDSSWNENLARIMWSIDVHNYCGTDTYYCKGYVPFCCYEMVRTGDKDYCQGYDTLSCLPSQCDKVEGSGSKNCAHGLKYYCPKDHNIDVSDAEPIPLSQRFPNDVIFYRLDKAKENERDLVKQKKPELWDLYVAYKASGGPWFPPAGDVPANPVSPTPAPDENEPTDAPSVSPTPVVTSNGPTSTPQPLPTTLFTQPTSAPTSTPTPGIGSQPSSVYLTPFTQSTPAAQVPAGQQVPTAEQAAVAVPFSTRGLLTFANTSNKEIIKTSIYLYTGGKVSLAVPLNPQLATQEFVLPDLISSQTYVVKAYARTKDGAVYTQTNKCSRSSLLDACVLKGPTDTAVIIIAITERATSDATTSATTNLGVVGSILDFPKLLFSKILEYDKSLNDFMEDIIQKYNPIK